MEQRVLGKTGRPVSIVGLGTWQLGADQAALRWVTQQPGVTTVIPGARNPGQARQNAAAGLLPPLSETALGQIEALRDKYLRADVHPRW